jgi:hypothetical protein
MKFKIISSFKLPLAFYDKSGVMTPSYGIVFISTIDDKTLEYLGVNELMQKLKVYGFERAKNPHMTIGFVAIDLKNLDNPYNEQDVEMYFKEAKVVWQSEPLLSSFSITFSDLEFNPQTRRSAVRLTTHFTNSKIVNFKQKYIDRFGLSLSSDYSTALHFGLASRINFSDKEEKEIREILSEFNQMFRCKSITVDKVNLVYHQNHFVVDNLREEEFLLD